MAVISFSSLVMLGFLGTGLQSVRQAVGSTTQAQIMQSIVNNASVHYYPTSGANAGIFTNSSGTAPAVYYFDGEGGLMTSAVGSIYSATIKSAPMSLPTSSSSSGTQVASSTASLLTVVIASVNNPSGSVTNTLVWTYTGN